MKPAVASTETRTPAARKRPPAEVIVFVDPTKKRKTSGGGEVFGDRKLESPAGRQQPRPNQFAVSRMQPPADDSGISSARPVINLNKARYEVFKLGVTGLPDKAKEDARVAHAIRLGAKPPKNKYVNYKLLQEEKRKEKERDRLAQDLFGKQSKKSKSNNTRGKTKGDTDFGQLGRFKNGVQVLSKADIAKITGKR